MSKLTKVFMIIAVIAIGIVDTVNAQVAINTDGSMPDASAMLDVKSTDKGLLPPRVAKVSDVSNPVESLLVYEEYNHCLRYYNGSEWSDCMGGETVCPTQLTDAENNTYNVVRIGSQCWMAENLNVGIMINGSNSQSNNDTIEKYCYNDDTANCDIYGGLYQWNEMMQYVSDTATKGICPYGWHLPTDTEYKTMEIYLGMTQTQADATGWRGTDEGSKLAGNEPLWPNGNLDQNANFGTSGFAALPGGARSTGGVFYDQNTTARLWSSNEYNANAWYRYLNKNNTTVRRGSDDKNLGFSVRCVKN